MDEELLWHNDYIGWDNGLLGYFLNFEIMLIYEKGRLTQIYYNLLNNTILDFL